jgi:hypothetical protein
MAKTKTQTIVTKQILTYLSLTGLVVLLVLGAAAYWAYDFAGGMVKSELSAQKIYFPDEGSPALDPETYPDLQQYAGELVDTPEEAKAYANGYIGRHLKEVAGGKVYSEVSTLSRLDPTNQTLLAQKQTLFQGETLRGILLTSGYGFGTIGKIAGIVSVLSFVGAALLLGVVVLLRIKR